METVGDEESLKLCGPKKYFPNLQALVHDDDVGIAAFREPAFRVLNVQKPCRGQSHCL
jgi:hypothetical protein